MHYDGGPVLSVHFPKVDKQTCISHNGGGMRFMQENSKELRSFQVQRHLGETNKKPLWCMRRSHARPDLGLGVDADVLAAAIVRGKEVAWTVAR